MLVLPINSPIAYSDIFVIKENVVYNRELVLKHRTRPGFKILTVVLFTLSPNNKYYK